MDGDHNCIPTHLYQLLEVIKGSRNKVTVPLVVGIDCYVIELNPRPGRGGVDATPPEVFLRCTPNYEADRAEILHTLWGILCATFGKKKLTGSCQVTEL